MKNFIIFLLICGATTICLSNLRAQDNFSLRVNAGVTGASTSIGGYYFSFDFGIPLLKAIELSPTFTAAKIIPETHIYNSWGNGTGVSYGVPLEGPKTEFENGSMFTSISLLVLFKPFELIDNEELARHQLIIGAGYGYKSYVQIASGYEISGGQYDVTRFSYKSSNGFEPYYAKVGYNYKIKSNLLAGIVTGLEAYDGEPELLLGIQFGVQF